MADLAVKRRQVELPGTRFSLSPSPPISLPGTRLSTVDSTQTETETQSQTSSSSLPGSSANPSSTVASTPSPSLTMTTLPGTRISLSDTSSPSGTSTPAQSFTFATIPYPTACTSATFDWTYTGPQETFELAVSSSITPHTDSTPSRKRQGQTFQLPIAWHVDATAQTWTWPIVTVPAGWYVLAAIGDDWVATSPQFFVTNGTDTSCLSATSTSSSAAATSTGTSTGMTSTTSAIPSHTVLPVTGATSSTSRAGAIAGGVIGGVVLIAAAIAAYIYFGLCRRTPTRSRRRAMDGRTPAQLGKWGGLSSLDSGMDAPVAAARPGLVMAIPSKKRGKTESTGAILTPLSSTAHGHSGAARGISDEDVATLAEEKGVPHTKGREYIETVQPLAYSNRRRSSASTSGAGLSPIASVAEPLSSAGSNARSRTRSSSQSHRAMALAKLDGEDPVAAPSPRTRSPTVPRRSIDGAPMAMPASLPYDVSPMNRSSSGGGPGAGARRAARKPVPQLDSSELSMPPTPTSAGASVSRGQSVASTVTYTSTSPLTSAHQMYRHESQSSGTLRASASGPVRQHSREDLEAAGMELPNLNHKSSFGDRPVHYLIPDMPPPPRR
ncbi:hypothetical protein C8T65DRAFT_86824 [Cerioporus squamosus]|nr:hypothetical protein C8T65DRAFT_86824 [Cerioporus squamosus]